VTDPHHTDPLDLVPDPGAVHRRIGELTRQAQLLRRLLRLALAAREERQRCDPPPAEVRHAR
jgi:hypothetical protein